MTKTAVARVPMCVLVLTLCALAAFIGTASASAATPEIKSESVSGITEENAVLEAKINPGGLETTVQFHLQTEPCGGVGVCQSIVVYPLPSSSLAASSTDEDVSLNLNSDASVTLSPGVTYRYWVEATNSAGPSVKGIEQTFTTTPKPEAALVSSRL